MALPPCTSFLPHHAFFFFNSLDFADLYCIWPWSSPFCEVLRLELFSSPWPNNTYTSSKSWPPILTPLLLVHLFVGLRPRPRLEVTAYFTFFVTRQLVSSFLFFFFASFIYCLCLVSFNVFDVLFCIMYCSLYVGKEN